MIENELGILKKVPPLSRQKEEGEQPSANLLNF